MSTFTLCFTFLHVLFERCNYFNNGCVLFSITFLSFLLFIFFLFVNRVSLRPGQSRHAAGGGKRPQSANPPPAHVYLSLSLSSPSIKCLYSASAALYLGEPPLVTPQISRMILALPPQI